MEDKKVTKSEQDTIDVDKKIFTTEEEKEVINCEGTPCNFTYKDTDKK